MEPGALIVLASGEAERLSRERPGAVVRLRRAGGGLELGRVGWERAEVEGVRVGPGARLHPLLSAAEAPRGEAVLASVFFAPDVDALGEGRESARRCGGEVVGSSRLGNALLVRATREGLAALALGEDALWIEPAPAPLTEANDGVRLLAQADIAQSPPYGLSGAGVRAMVLDSGVADVTHPDFAGRLSVMDGSPVRQHSTHVSGTLGGSGAASGGLYRGVAPGVEILSYGFEFGSQSTNPSGSPLFLYTDPGDLENDYYDAVMVHGADLTTNSLSTNVSPNGWDCVLEGDYALMSVILDAVVAGSLGRPVPVVWAAGNERGGLARCGTTYFTTPPPATAKNVIAVGAATSDLDTVAFFSSWGPTDDGRLRPDLIAPGHQIGEDNGVTSANVLVFGTPYYTTFGTSMAAPAVAGAVALLLEDFRAQFAGQPDPLPSTHKALLLHAAEDVGPPGPDFQSGYGSLRIADAVDLLRSGRFLEESAREGEAFVCFVDVPPGAPELRATIAWDDPPGLALISPALVNDLDLRVFSPSEAEHFPWTLSAANPAAPAVRNAPDRLNNVEQVVVDAPAPGRWRVEVRGHAVGPEGQKFSLAASPALSAVSVEMVGGAPASVVPGEPTALSVRVRTVGEALASAPTLRHRRGGGALESIPMADMGGGVWTAALPASPCLGEPQFLVETSGTVSGVVAEPLSGVHAPTPRQTIVHFEDDFESNLGWVVGDPSDTATQGIWTRVDPRGSRAQPEHDRTPDGVRCYVTGQNPAGASPSNGDVDGGRTTLTSPPIDLSDAPGARIAYWRWFSNITGPSPQQDVFRVQIAADGGPWVEVETLGPSGADSVGGWRRHDFRVADLVSLPATVRLRFIAEDLPPDSIVEAAVDDVLVYSEVCASTFCPGDADGDGQVGFSDLNIVLSQFNTSGPGLTGDLNGDGHVNFADLNLVLGVFNTPCFDP